MFDEPHPAHVRGELVHFASIAAHAPALVNELEVGGTVVHALMDLIPFSDRLNVHGTHGAILASELGNEVPANEASGTCNKRDSMSHEANSGSHANRGQVSRRQPRFQGRFVFAGLVKAGGALYTTLLRSRATLFESRGMHS